MSADDDRLNYVVEMSSFKIFCSFIVVLCLLSYVYFTFNLMCFIVLGIFECNSEVCLGWTLNRNGVSASKSLPEKKVRLPPENLWKNSKIW